MKVIHLLTSLDYGGVERRMEILSLYPPSQYEVRFCAIGRGGATLDAIKKNNGFAVNLDLDYRIIRVRTLFALFRYFKDNEPDVVHAHGAEANFYGVLVGRLAGVPKIFTEEIGIPNLSKKAKLVFALVHRWADAVVAMSPVVRKYLIDNNLSDASKTHLVYNPVLISRRQKKDFLSKKSVVRFVFVGRLEAVKNPTGLLFAFHEYLKSGRQGVLTYIGGGSQKEYLKKEARRLGLEDHVSIVGFKKDVLNVLTSFDVVVQPSITEGFSVALAEAMSCGLPAVSTPVGSAPDLIVDGKNGWLVASSEVSDICVGLCHAWEQRSRLKIMGDAATKSVLNRHSPELYSDKLFHFYEKYI